jgi:hypothetical protein
MKNPPLTSTADTLANRKSGISRLILILVIGMPFTIFQVSNKLGIQVLLPKVSVLSLFLVQKIKPRWFPTPGGGECLYTLL